MLNYFSLGKTPKRKVKKLIQVSEWVCAEYDVDELKENNIVSLHIKNNSYLYFIYSITLTKKISSYITDFPSKMHLQGTVY